LFSIFRITILNIHPAERWKTYKGNAFHCSGEYKGRDEDVMKGFPASVLKNAGNAD